MSLATLRKRGSQASTGLKLPTLIGEVLKGVSPLYWRELFFDNVLSAWMISSRKFTTFPNLQFFGQIGRRIALFPAENILCWIYLVRYSPSFSTILFQFILISLFLFFHPGSDLIAESEIVNAQSLSLWVLSLFHARHRFTIFQWWQKIDRAGF